MILSPLMVTNTTSILLTAFLIFIFIFLVPTSPQWYVKYLLNFTHGHLIVMSNLTFINRLNWFPPSTTILTMFLFSAWYQHSSRDSKENLAFILDSSLLLLTFNSLTYLSDMHLTHFPNWTASHHIYTFYPQPEHQHLPSDNSNGRFACLHSYPIQSVLHTTAGDLFGINQVDVFQRIFGLHKVHPEIFAIAYKAPCELCLLCPTVLVLFLILYLLLPMPRVTRHSGFPWDLVNVSWSEFFRVLWVLDCSFLKISQIRFGRPPVYNNDSSWHGLVQLCVSTVCSEPSFHFNTGQNMKNDQEYSVILLSKCNVTKASILKGPAST